MFNLARTYLHLGEHARSYDLLVLVLEKRMHFFGPDHPDTLMAKNELGMNLCAQRLRLDEAEVYVHEVLESRKKVLGEEHAYTLWSVNDLSKIYCELGRFDKSVEILEEIVPVVERTLGDKHVGMIMTKSNLTRALILCEKWAEADKIIRKLREIVPRDHPDWIHVNWGHAYILVHEGQLGDAETLCIELLTQISTTRVLDASNPRVIAIAELLLKVYTMQEREADITKLKEEFPRVEDDELLSSIDHMPLGKLRRRVTGHRLPSS
jgi:tetratricopeptide (TPR) repeat protein